MPVEVETDGTLIEWSARGRPDAFVEVVRRHEIAVHGFLARRAGPAVAADLLGEVWVRAFAGRGGYDPAYPDARPWLLGIARNVLRWHWRSARAADHPSGAGQVVAEARRPSVCPRGPLAAACTGPGPPCAWRSPLPLRRNRDAGPPELERLAALGHLDPPPPGVLDAAREVLWSAVAQEMLALGPAAGRAAVPGQGAPGQAAERHADRSRPADPDA